MGFPEIKKKCVCEAGKSTLINLDIQRQSSTKIE
jgi:hypothetical protein